MAFAVTKKVSIKGSIGGFTGPEQWSPYRRPIPSLCGSLIVQRGRSFVAPGAAAQTM
jgi:hypothetical protein